MLDLSTFIVRISGRRENTYYIDCTGLYRVEDIAKAGGISAEKLRGIYEKNGGVLNGEVGVYYFDSIPGAKNAIAKIIEAMSGLFKGKSVFLAEAEIEYIRNSLISRGGSAGADNRVADAILEKLNR